MVVWPEALESFLAVLDKIAPQLHLLLRAAAEPPRSSLMTSETLIDHSDDSLLSASQLLSGSVRRDLARHKFKG